MLTAQKIRCIITSAHCMLGRGPCINKQDRFLIHVRIVARRVEAVKIKRLVLLSFLVLLFAVLVFRRYKMVVARGVDRIETSRQMREGGGFLIRRPIGDKINQCDPFLLLDHMGPVVYGPGEAVGAPDHPHRGFETVTYLIDGKKGKWSLFSAVLLINVSLFDKVLN